MLDGQRDGMLLNEVDDDLATATTGVDDSSDNEVITHVRVINEWTEFWEDLAIRFTLNMNLDM